MNAILKTAIPVISFAASIFMSSPMQAKDYEMATDGDGFPIISASGVPSITIDNGNFKGIGYAAGAFALDMKNVCGQEPDISDELKGPYAIIIGTPDGRHIKKLAKERKIDLSGLKGAVEKYEMFFVPNPADGVDEALVVVGSDRRGAIYGIYELSEQIGVSPWNWWADVPAERRDSLNLMRGRYTNGEPAVRYRGIFLNDEAPCLTSWVKNQFGTNYGGHEFYAKVFELILRLRGNYLWPAMWSWAFYADDPLNSPLADEMGVIIGTSHHEPMARNHQEWARNRSQYGAWDYAINQNVIDEFFREGVRRVADKEDIITIGMRGDGDAPMGGEEGHDHEYVSRDQENLRLLERIIKNQRQIIKQETGQSPDKHPQLWALYKEVQKYYDMGLRVPDDVIILLSDDNWGNVRRVPTEQESEHPGGFGLYYHVDYVGAPRNTKWLNVTPIQGMWEQLSLAAEYGIDRLWILNVGDLKPMEYPITLFMDMAWNPAKYGADNILGHARKFCEQQFGEGQADEAADILNLYSKYAGRVTPEMLDRNTYSLESGEWRQARDEFLALEARALRQYISIEPSYRDAYKQLILFPVQALANLYDLYYCQAMNLKLYALGDPACNSWADKAEKAFARDKALCDDYNHVMSSGKWNGMMTQKHIGYSSWNDNFPADTMPEVHRINQAASQGGYVHHEKNGVVVIEAPHFYDATNGESAKWNVIPDLGRTLGGVVLLPHSAPFDGAELSYKIKLAQPADSVDVIIVTKSTLPFANKEGHRYVAAIDGAGSETINFNFRLNEDPENVYDVFYPTVARRVVESRTKIAAGDRDEIVLKLRPLDPGVVFEKIVVDRGGYEPSYLYGLESPMTKE